MGKSLNRVTLDGEKLRDNEPKWPQRCAACGKTCTEHMTIASDIVSDQAFSEFFPSRKFTLPMHAWCKPRFRFHWYTDKFSNYLVPLALVVAGVIVYETMHTSHWSHDAIVTLGLAVFAGAALVSAITGLMTRPAVYIEEIPLHYNGLRRKGERYLYDFLFRDERYGSDFKQLNQEMVIEPPEPGTRGRIRRRT